MRPAGLGPLGPVASVPSISSTFSACGSWATLSAVVTPFTRDSHTMVYDPVRDRLLIFGGISGTGDFTNDVWALSLGGTPTLTQVTTSGTPPPARQETAAIYDPGRDRLVIFSGHGSSGELNDVWALSL
ncbi:MAG TPA: kelch repeat-containing protein, partial [Candidatus Eisenbacteria bacterium]